MDNFINIKNNDNMYEPSLYEPSIDKAARGYVCALPQVHILFEFEYIIIC